MCVCVRARAGGCLGAGAPRCLFNPRKMEAVQIYNLEKLFIIASWIRTLTVGARLGVCLSERTRRLACVCASASVCVCVVCVCARARRGMCMRGRTCVCVCVRARARACAPSGVRLRARRGRARTSVRRASVQTKETLPLDLRNGSEKATRSRRATRCHHCPRDDTNPMLLEQNLTRECERTRG